MWVPAEIEDVKETYKFEAHKPRQLTKRIPWLVCQYCGLVYLKNNVSRWCISKGCLHELHKDYKKQFK
jgi:hypothetical protein